MRSIRITRSIPLQREGTRRGNLRGGFHAWISGTAAKVVAAAKKTTSKPGAVKSGAATAVKDATKKVVTSTKNTV